MGMGKFSDHADIKGPEFLIALTTTSYMAPTPWDDRWVPSDYALINLDEPGWSKTIYSKRNVHAYKEEASKNTLYHSIRLSDVCGRL